MIRLITDPKLILTPIVKILNIINVTIILFGIAIVFIYASLTSIAGVRLKQCPVGLIFGQIRASSGKITIFQLKSYSAY